MGNGEGKRIKMENILLVIDVQKGFITNPEVTAVKERIDELIALNCFDCVIATVYKNYENSPIITLMGWDRLLDESEQQLIGNARYHSDYIVKKTTYSAVNDDLLEAFKKICHGTNPECVYIVGVDTECCVLATATDLFELGIRPIVLTNYCGSSSGIEHHKAGLISLQSLIGKCNMSSAKVTSAADVDQIFEIALERTALKNVKKDPIESVIVSMLKAYGWHISFAESCTGGLVTAKIVSVPAASSVFNVSHVTYANTAKVEYLNVEPKTIDEFGVVSEQVAKEMAVGIAKRNNTEVGIGITGIAGPGGATERKPVGMVCFGFYINGEVYTYTVQFGNIGRNNVRNASVDFVYETLRKLLKDSEI